MFHSGPKALGKFPSRISNSTGSLNQYDQSLDLVEIKGLLGNKEIKFINGIWIRDEIEQLDFLPDSVEMKWKTENNRIKEENNLLKLKIEILYTMLSTKTAELIRSNEEIADLQKLFRKTKCLTH